MMACSQTNSANAQRTGQWQPVCLDRLLIDLPGPVEVGASNVVYQGGYNFPGVTSIGARGIKWNGVTFDETHVTDEKGYDSFRDLAKGRLPNANSLKSAIKAYQDENRIWTDRLNEGTQEARASAREFIDENNGAIAEAKRSYKVSGFARLDKPNTFAVRHGDTYKIGYLDPIDKRIRYFEGTLTPTERAVESPEAAGEEYKRFSRIYHRRETADIPTAPGYCTAHGFIDEPASYKPQEGDSLNLPFRSLKYPNLVFILIVEPARASGPRNALEQDNPNEMTIEDIKKLKGPAAAGALASFGQIKSKYGPKRIEMAGQTGGRIYGREYHHKDYLEENGPATAYEFEAEVMGEQGRTDRPHIKLQMGAALADAPDLPAGQEPIRPALKGHTAPSFEEGLMIFEEVVKSVRVRPVNPRADESAAH